MSFIKINKLIIKKNFIQANFLFSQKIKKYFNYDSFYVKYDCEIANVSESILAIPFVSTVVTIAWATGADLYVNQIDKRYLRSLNEIRRIMKQMHPFFSCSTKICVQKVVTNKIKNTSKKLLLFSKGVDSIASYFKHKKENLLLVGLSTGDIFYDIDVWKKAKREIINFAKREKIKIHLIESDMYFFANKDALVSRYGKHFITSSWWAPVQHGIALTGLLAPLTILEKVQAVYIASTNTSSFDAIYPWGSCPDIDNNISWANVKVIHDCYKLSRQEKIRYIKQKCLGFKKPFPKLKSCPSYTITGNCNKCFKCYQAIVGLLLEGLNPNNCGFKMNNKTLGRIKQYIIEKEFSVDEFSLWEDIQRHIPQKIKNDLYDSKVFFEWLKQFRIKERRKLNLCPACGGNMHLFTKKVNFFMKRVVKCGNYFYYKCAKCGHILLDIPEDVNLEYQSNYRKNMPMDGDITNGRLSRKYYSNRKEILRKRVNRINRFIKGGGTIFDVGCGGGYLLNYYKKRGYKVSGIEIDDLCVNACKRIWIPCLKGDFTKMVAKKKYDVVMAWHFLEHIKDLNISIKKILKITKRNGLVIIEIPVKRPLIEDWKEYDGHMHYFNRKSFKALMERYSLQDVYLKEGVQSPALLFVGKIK